MEEKFNKPSLRLATFKSDNWPSGKPDIKALAEAGFYYEGVRDVTTCYSCNFKLHGWEPQDDPWQEHEKTRNHCDHLQKHKDAAAAKRSQEQEKPSRDPGVSKPAPTDKENKKKSSDKEKSSKPKKEKKEKKRHTKAEKETQMAQPEVTSNSDNSQGQEMEELKKEIEELKEQSSDVRCKICLDEIVQLIFLPCKHLSVCAECGKDMNKCPICRKWVVEQMKIYM